MKVILKEIFMVILLIKPVLNKLKVNSKDNTITIKGIKR
jgi:hypothetical protein